MQLTNFSNMDSSGALQTIGKYQIVGTLGRGSMGIVYKGRDPEIGRLVAIKTLRKISSPQFQEASANIERFKLEARSAGNLRHPNIITIFDINVEGDTPYIVMDYVEGESLDQLIVRLGAIEPAVTLHYLAEAAAGLDYAHSKGVIHKDIKPSNIIVDRSQRVFLLDFGIASMSDSLAEAKPAKDQTVLGSPGYMSAEQIMNQGLDGRSDLFSLAVVGFECLTGKRPFPGDNFTQVVGNILNSKPLSLTALSPTLPLALEVEFEKALSRDREQRFKSGAEMVSAFREALGMRSASIGEGRPGGQQRRKRASTWRSLSAIGPIDDPEAQAKEREQSDAGQPADFHPVSSAAAAPANAYARGASASQENFYAPTRDVLARSEHSLGHGSLQIGRDLSATRFVLLVAGFILIFSAGYLTWAYLTSARVSQTALQRDIKPRVSLEEPLDSTDLVMPQHAPVPPGKEIPEMSDGEVLGVLASKDQPETQVIAALREALERHIGGLAAIAAVPLQSDSYIVRIEAIKTMAALGDKRVVPRLVVSLDDYDPLVRIQAAKALGALGSRAALGYLSARLLREDAPQVKAAIKHAVDQIQGLD